MVRKNRMGRCFYGKKMTPYIERKNTHKKLFNDLLKKNIKAVDIAAANMLNPEDYPVFDKLMKKLIKGYK